MAKNYFYYMGLQIVGSETTTRLDIVKRQVSKAAKRWFHGHRLIFPGNGGLSVALPERTTEIAERLKATRRSGMILHPPVAAGYEDMEAAALASWNRFAGYLPTGSVLAVSIASGTNMEARALIIEPRSPERDWLDEGKIDPLKRQWLHYYASFRMPDMRAAGKGSPDEKQLERVLMTALRGAFEGWKFQSNKKYGGRRKCSE